jgi:hypothetical protein
LGREPWKAQHALIPGLAGELVGLLASLGVVQFRGNCRVAIQRVVRLSPEGIEGVH